MSALAAATSTHAFAQLSAENVIGRERSCRYANPSGGDPRSIKVGIGESCPAYYPTASRNTLPPPTARLESSSEKDGQRVCIYEQRNRTWRFTIALTEQCAPTAGTFDEQTKSASSG